MRIMTSTHNEGYNTTSGNPDNEWQNDDCSNDISAHKHHCKQLSTK